MATSMLLVTPSGSTGMKEILSFGHGDSDKKEMHSLRFASEKVTKYTSFYIFSYHWFTTSRQHNINII